MKFYIKNGLGLPAYMLKLLLIMRLTFVLLITLFVQISLAGYSQQITMSKKNASLEQVFRQIHIQTGYNILCDYEVLSTAKPIDIQLVNSSLKTALDLCIKGQSLTYTIDKNTIIVKRKYEEPTVAMLQVTIKGTVTDDKGLPLPGVTVTEKGTNNTITTNASGNYTIKVADPNASLVFSFIGFNSTEVKVGSRTTINVSLAEKINDLNEVVVIGYGSRKKSDLTGAVATMSSANLKDRPVLNFGEAMAGQLAGVQVQEINGAPGGEGLSIRVRGTGSITQSNSPLYVVDGYPMEDGAFRLVNPADIETLQVLKDASSTAIYGSRGANGVVIITTKKGKIGSPSISVNAFTGYQQRTKIIPVLNRDQYVQWFMDGRNQAWLDQPVISGDPNTSPHSINDPNSRRSLYPSANTLYTIPDGTNGYKYNFFDPKSVAQMPDNNWQELMFRLAKMQQYELSITGGTENTKYAFSGSYINQDGILLNTDYKRFNFRNNVESQINKRLKVGMNLNVYSAGGDEQTNGKYSPLQFALQLPPIFDLHNPDGTYGSMVRNPEVFAGDVANPIGVAEQIYTYRKRYGWLGTMFGELDLAKGLKYRININGGIQDNNLEDYEPSTVDLDASKAPRPARAFNERSTDYDWVIEQTLSYNKTFAKKHDLVLLGGFSAQKHNNDYMYGEARGFPNDNIQTLNAGTMYQLTSTKSAYSMISYFGRANYTFDNRYLLTGTIRTDGSSRFGDNKKWGVFPSVSGAWRVSQEHFMSKISGVINDLKLRASYGIAGNNRIGNYSGIGLLNTGFYPTGGALQSAVIPNTVPNNNLGWEKILQSNFGFDLGLFNDRIRLEGDYYNSKSIDLLLNVPVPTVTGYSSQIQNIGKVLNKGVELLLTTQNFVGKFKWSTNFNIAFNTNKVLEVGPGGQPIYGSAPNATNAFITLPGSPIASFYGYVYQGVFMNQQQLNQYPHLAGDKVGDGRYLDVNGDGKLDQTDKAIIGNNQPKYTGGFSNNFSYKNFSLSAQFSYSYGAHAFSFFKRMVGIYHGDRNGLIEQVNRWQSVDQPGDGIHFRATRNPTGWQREPSSSWVTDASYLRLRNVTLAYDFTQSAIKTLKLNGLRLYVTSQNLYTWTKYPGYDPETSSEGEGLTKGGDYLGYPAARSIIVGLNLTF
ncbi:MAG: TonB-dependent receptor plug [Mucilaginibacter sp.]|nr:TonB-dependent receptor plug [Mucilaginibacter sp.]